MWALRKIRKANTYFDTLSEMMRTEVILRSLNKKLPSHIFKSTNISITEFMWTHYGVSSEIAWIHSENVVDTLKKTNFKDIIIKQYGLKKARIILDYE